MNQSLNEFFCPSSGSAAALESTSQVMHYCVCSKFPGGTSPAPRAAGGRFLSVCSKVQIFGKLIRHRLSFWHWPAARGDEQGKTERRGDGDLDLNVKRELPQPLPVSRHRRRDRQRMRSRFYSRRAEVQCRNRSTRS